MRKKIGYILLVAVTAFIGYSIFKETTWSPLGKKDFNYLFPNYDDNAIIVYHKDFIGWSHGDYFEMFIYRLNNIHIEPSYPKIKQDWEYTTLPDTTKVIKWLNCPIDSITQAKYNYELAWITDSEVNERKMLKNDLEDVNNYYSCIYVSGLQKYFLLYSPSKKILYYIRQNGF